MANVERVYRTLNHISTVAKRERLLKSDKFKTAMLDLSFDLASELSATRCSIQDRDLCPILGRAAVRAYKAASAAFNAAHLSQQPMSQEAARHAYQVMHAAFSLARAIDGGNLPNVAYYSLLLEDHANTATSFFLG